MAFGVRLCHSCNHGFTSHIANVIFRDVLGIEAVDENNRIIYLNHDYTAPETAEAEFPLTAGTLIITVKNYKRTVKVIGDYNLLQ